MAGVRDAARRPLRVIQWSTGNAGRCAVRGIVRHPDLELVGLHAHAADKQGRDAAELAGLDAPTGVRATNDVDALLDLLHASFDARAFFRIFAHNLEVVIQLRVV